MIGYEFLQAKLPIRMPELSKPARVSSVTRITELSDMIATPKAIAPKTDALLAHVVFALKHEPMQLATLHEALKQVSAEEMSAALAQSPARVDRRLHAHGQCPR